MTFHLAVFIRRYNHCFIINDTCGCNNCTYAKTFAFINSWKKTKQKNFASENEANVRVRTLVNNQVCPSGKHNCANSEQRGIMAKQNAWSNNKWHWNLMVQAFREKIYCFIDCNCSIVKCEFIPQNRRFKLSKSYHSLTRCANLSTCEKFRSTVGECDLKIDFYLQNFQFIRKHKKLCDVLLFLLVS